MSRNCPERTLFHIAAAIEQCERYALRAPTEKELHDADALLHAFAIATRTAARQMPLLLAENPSERMRFHHA